MSGRKSGQTVVEYLLLLLFVVLIAIKVSEFMRNAFKKGGGALKKDVIERNLKTGIGFK